MNSNLVISKSIISLNSEDWSLWGQSQSLVLWVLRTEKEVLRAGNRNTSFCTALRPGNEKRRKDGGERQEKKTFVLLNTGDCDIYNILNIYFGSFQYLVHSNLQFPKGVLLPRRSVVAYTCLCVCDFTSFFRSFYMHYILFHVNSTTTLAKIIPWLCWLWNCWNFHFKSGIWRSKG